MAFRLNAGPAIRQSRFNFDAPRPEPSRAVAQLKGRMHAIRMNAAPFAESLHPRGEGGKFAFKNGGKATGSGGRYQLVKPKPNPPDRGHPLRSRVAGHLQQERYARADREQATSETIASMKGAQYQRILGRMENDDTGRVVNRHHVAEEFRHRQRAADQLREIRAERQAKPAAPTIKAKPFPSAKPIGPTPAWRTITPKPAAAAPPVNPQAARLQRYAAGGNMAPAVRSQATRGGQLDMERLPAARAEQARFLRGWREKGQAKSRQTVSTPTPTDPAPAPSPARPAAGGYDLRGQVRAAKAEHDRRHTANQIYTSEGQPGLRRLGIPEHEVAEIGSRMDRPFSHWDSGPIEQAYPLHKIDESGLAVKNLLNKARSIAATARAVPGAKPIGPTTWRTIAPKPTATSSQSSQDTIRQQVAQHRANQLKGMYSIQTPSDIAEYRGIMARSARSAKKQIELLPNNREGQARRQSLEESLRQSTSNAQRVIEARKSENGRVYGAASDPAPTPAPTSDEPAFSLTNKPERPRAMFDNVPTSQRYMPGMDMKKGDLPHQASIFDKQDDGFVEWRHVAGVNPNATPVRKHPVETVFTKAHYPLIHDVVTTTKLGKIKRDSLLQFESHEQATAFLQQAQAAGFYATRHGKVLKAIENDIRFRIGRAQRLEAAGIPHLINPK